MGPRLLLCLAAGSLGAFPQANPSVCAGCHQEIWQTYQRTGMGRSFYRPSADNVPLASGSYFHAASKSHFTMLQRGGEFFQRRHQVDSAGREINVMEKRVDYVMGSGNHARAYLHRTAADTLVELPLGWYAEKGGYWAMNPGYDRPDHDEFRRPITYECMFCHNAYPRIPAVNEKPWSEPVYSGPLPTGIDCERCHGSGARHIAAAAKPGTAKSAIRGAIVNPARLAPDRQFELCMSCHLETTSNALPNAIQRYDRGPFSFRPGEALGAFLLSFDHAPEAGRQDKFEIVNAAYRVRQSACFLKSSGKLLCTSCHSPHDAPRGAAAERHYTAACLSCHTQPLSGEAHASRTGCAGCHMPNRRTEDVIHAVATDHRIQRRPPPGDLLAERAEHIDTYRGEVVLYYPPSLPPGADSELYQAVAQVKQKSNLKAGIPRLEAAIARYKPTRADWYLELADALEQDGQLARSVDAYREVIRRDPAMALAWQKLGTVLRRLKRVAEAVPALEKSAALASRAVTWHELGLSFRAAGRPADALAALRKATEMDPDFPEAHSNLGILQFESGNAAAAERAFEEAVRIKPSYADARSNLAGLRYSNAMAFGRAGRYDDAQRELEAALGADPSFADGHELLGDLLLGRNQRTAAESHYRTALGLRPASPRAHLGLGLALASAGDRDNAIVHLRAAAAGSDPGFRQRALEVLEQMGASVR